MNIYIEEIKIPYYDCNYKNEMHPTAILKYLSEISINHNELESDLEIIEKNKYGWMINKWKVEIDRYPEAKEKIKIETWVSKVDMFFVNREFAIYDMDNNEIIRATAVWIFMDMNRRRPIRFEKRFYNEQDIIEKNYFRDFKRFKRNRDYEKSIDFKIRRLDIDNNNHVNNVIYFIWMLEAIDDDIYNNYKLRRFEIDYKNEVSYPSIISSKIKVEDIKGDLNIYHEISESDKKIDNALAKSKWIKNS